MVAATAAGHLVADEAGTSPEWPPGGIEGCAFLTREAHCVPIDTDGLDARRRVLELRLAGDRVDDGIDHGADARVGGIAVAPVDRYEERAALHLAARLHAHDDRTPSGRHFRELAGAEAAGECI